MALGRQASFSGVALSWTQYRLAAFLSRGSSMPAASTSESTDLQSSADFGVQVQVARLSEDNHLLRIRLSSLEDRVARLEAQDREAHIRLQRRVQPSDCAIGCLTTRVIHLGACFQHLVVAIQRAFPRPPGFWQSLEEN